MSEPTRRKFLGRIGAGAASLLLPELSALPLWAQESRALSIGGVPVRLSVAAISPQTVRISMLDATWPMTANSAFRHKGLLDKPWPAAQHVFTAVAEPQTFSFGAITVTVRPEPLRIRVEERERGIAQELTFDSANGAVTFLTAGRPVFGLGEGGHQFDRRGVQDNMQNGQYKPEQFVYGARNPMPWLVSPAGWAIYFHHPMGEFDLRHADNGIFRPFEPPSAQDIFVSLAGEPAALMREFAALTGSPHLPPLWAFGYQQSHRTLSSRDEVLAELKTFREKKLPCDVMIYLGTGYAPSGWNQGHGSFAFNNKIFPDPTQMFEQFHREDFRAVLHVLDEPRDLHGVVNDPPSDDPDAAQNYWKEHLPVMRTGIDGWWVDDGDELLPEARLARTRMYWDGMRKVRPQRRPYALHRNSYAGSQMYGWLWSGDTRSTWETLRQQVAVGLNAGLSGLPYWGTDTGGFFSTPELTAELYVRWFQFSAFCTLFRSHGRTWHLRLPWGWNTGEYGPVEDDMSMLPGRDELHHPEVEGICRKYLNLRYSLLPYLYSMAWICHTTGMPVMRALWMHFPQDGKTATIADEYMWGDHLLVAPVVEKSAHSRRVYLPAGDWYDFWTHEKLSGAQQHERPVDLATMPVFARAGTILPVGPVKQYALEKSDEPLTLRVYPGQDGVFTLYEDDGDGFAYEKGAFSRTRFSWTDAGRKLKIELVSQSGMHPFTTRNLTIEAVDSGQSKPVHFSGTPVEVSM